MGALAALCALAATGAAAGAETARRGAIQVDAARSSLARSRLIGTYPSSILRAWIGERLADATGVTD